MQMTEVNGSAAATAMKSARSQTASLPDETMIDTPSARSRAAAAAARARNPLWETMLTPPTVAAPATGRSSHPPVKRLTPSATFRKPAQLGPTTASAVRSAIATSRFWASTPSRPISANPDATTTTPPHPSAAASSTTVSEASALTIDSTASIGLPADARSGTTCCP